MSKMKFKYFRDPENFSYIVDEESKCSICHKTGLWFDAGGFTGPEDIECICEECLLSGRLKDLKIEANQAAESSQEALETIIYRTPPLPTWQDTEWPFVNGDYCIFEKIASKNDFTSKEEFKQSFSKTVQENSDIDRLWETLPDTKITSLKDGNYNVSVYLFTTGESKYCTWDAN